MVITKNRRLQVISFMFANKRWTADGGSPRDQHRGEMMRDWEVFRQHFASLPKDASHLSSIGYGTSLSGLD